MKLIVSNGVYARSDRYKWVLQDDRSPFQRQRRCSDFASLDGLATGLMRRQLLPRHFPFPMQRLTAEARALASLIIPVLGPSAEVSFANGGFIVKQGHGDYVLLNPTKEVVRLPAETDANRRKTVVGYPASLDAALVLAVERCFLSCEGQMPFAQVERALATLSATLWSDLALTTGDDRIRKGLYSAARRGDGAEKVLTLLGGRLEGLDAHPRPLAQGLVL